MRLYTLQMMSGPHPQLPSDEDLFRTYLNRHDRQALGELIQRYAGMVYAAARRQVRDADLAQDVMQNVFVTFARRAHEIRSAAAIGTWLLQTTHFTSANAMKTENRRRVHEHAAGLSRPELTDNANPAEIAIAADEEQQWRAVYPLLDEAMSRLGSADQTAVVLRFLRGLSLREVAAATGTTEDGARKRVTRAIERLRNQLTRAGAPPAACGAAVLTVMLAGRAVEPAPAIALVHATSAAAASSVHAAGGSILHGVIAMSTGAKIAVAATVVILMSAGTVGIIRLAGISFSSPGPTLAAPLTPTAPNAPIASPVPETITFDDTPTTLPAPDWQAAFNAAYRLADGQTLKFVPAPFIPERADFVKGTMRRPGRFASRPPDQLIIAQQPDGTLKNLSVNLASGASGFGGPSVASFSSTAGGVGNAMGVPQTPGVTVATTFEKLATLQPWQLDGDAQLLNATVAGDWVVRQGATKDQIISALADLCGKQLNKKLVLSHSQVMKDVIVVAGTPKSTQPSDGAGSSVRWDSNTQGSTIQGSGTISAMVANLSRFLGIPFINQSQASPVQTLSYKLQIPPDLGQATANKLTQPLQDLATQTGLSFQPDQKLTDVWTLTAAP